MKLLSKIGPALRLRLGVVMLFIWWFPFWLVIPALLNYFGVTAGQHLTVAIVLTQTVIGIVGGLVAGKEVTGIIKSSGLKHTPKTIWTILWHGQV